MGTPGSDECLFGASEHPSSTRSTLARLAQRRAKAPLAQTHCLADAFHDLIGNFIRARCAPGEDVVDIGFVI